MTDLPTGTVTFVFTDIEGSTRLLQRLGDLYPNTLAEHRRIVRDAIVSCGGFELETEGDSFFAVFSSAERAVDATVRVQRGLAAHEWLANGEVRVRIGVHSGEGKHSDLGYVGMDVHRAARVASAGHGGQVLISGATRPLVERSLSEGVRVRDLGMHRLKDLPEPEHLYQLDIPGLPAEHPPLRTEDARRDNLPTELTSFIGRERDAAAVEGLLGRVRLVTLTGPGGTGKTRLALRVAADLIERFADGAFFVDLASITDPGVVPSAIATALSVRASPDQPLTEALREHVRRRDVLLVLDNFEQVSSAAALITDLLSVSPALHVLVTSRIALRVQGEQEYPVPPLSVPDAPASASPEALRSSEAVTLFVERALAVRPDFDPTEADLRDIAAIVVRLDGLPLAVELAAARTRMFTPTALLPRLEHALSFLTSGATDLPARQRTLRDAIAWSYGLLEPADELVFSRLSVFAGGATLTAAESVVGDAGARPPIEVLESLERLVDASLVRAGHDAEGEPRFTLLETIREFASERLAAAGATEVKDRHADFFITFAESADEHGRGPEQAVWLRRLLDERENLRAGLAWTLAQGDGLRALRLAGSLDRPFWFGIGGTSEGLRMLDAALDLATDAPPARRAKALQRAGWMATDTGDYGRGLAFMEQCLAEAQVAGDDASIAEASMGVAYWALYGGDRLGAEEVLSSALVHAERSGSAPLVGEVLVALGLAAVSRSDDAVGQERFERALSIARGAEDAWGTAWALLQLGQLAIDHGEASRGQVLLSESRDLARVTGDAQLVEYTHLTLGTALVELGDLDTARVVIDDAARRVLELATVNDPIWALELCARWFFAAGSIDEALLAWSAAKARRTASLTMHDPFDDRLHAQTADRFRVALGQDRVDAAVRVASADDLEGALTRAADLIRGALPDRD